MKLDKVLGATSIVVSGIGAWVVIGETGIRLDRITEDISNVAEADVVWPGTLEHICTMAFPKPRAYQSHSIDGLMGI